MPACVHTVGILGPMFGFMLGSYLAKIYVDIGFVNLGKDQNLLMCFLSELEWNTDCVISLLYKL